MIGLRLVLAIMLLCGLAPPSVAAQSVPVVSVAFEPPVLPEGLAVDGAGTVYVGIATTGEIRRIGSDGGRSTLATLRPGLGSLLGLAVDAQGNVLAALASQDTPGSDRHGVWRIAPDGAKGLLAPLPATMMPNALALGPGGALFVSDSRRGSVWRIGPDGTAAPWVQHELLEGDLQACPPAALNSPVGANGLAFDAAGSLLVANTTKAQIVRVAVRPDGSAGPPEVAYGPDCQSLAGADGIAADGAGGLFVTLNWQDRLVRIAPSGDVRVLATKSQGLDFPASLAVSRERLFLVNYAQLSYLNDRGPRPSLMSFELK